MRHSFALFTLMIGLLTLSTPVFGHHYEAPDINTEASALDIVPNVAGLDAPAPVAFEAAPEVAPDVIAADLPNTGHDSIEEFGFCKTDLPGLADSSSNIDTSENPEPLHSRIWETQTYPENPQGNDGVTRPSLDTGGTLAFVPRKFSGDRARGGDFRDRG